MADARPPGIYVLAGPNGAGKSSVLGAVLVAADLDFYNPDAAAHKLRRRHPEVTQSNANSVAWRKMRQDLEAAIRDTKSYAFETTLGGRTIAGLLHSAIGSGLEVHIWYIGLDSPERCIARVKQRVASGGHDIPEQRIRERYDGSRATLARLVSKVALLKVFDNSQEGDPPQPRLLLHVERGRIRFMADDAGMPEWAKPIAGAMNPSP